MSEIEKRSIVLTKDLAKRMDRYALQQHISFSSAIRKSCEQLLVEANSSNSVVGVNFTSEEAALLTKVCELSLKTKEDILKDCFDFAISSIVERIEKNKEFISELNKKL